ncbi:DUF1007 family protein [Sulfurospirillum deleyianum]|uniref:ABC-type uncharacterized transport system periplasmic component-like protein n=1 Tax=Sulfurospirillum deleyianum (strain ATCC 51133 / DSM 6946 / 5175) TaxID=525898 RepID=D1B4P1_SULD5|nr:DUF1007 family protein [Sulfurospirillum deleyianum]ACZ13061.1 ABC-type uncharacterized transport system periplasmic component-like protein [Sulfurospirillum deleyianum DSM 6946]
MVRIFSLFFYCALNLYAHPHTYIDVYLKISENTLKIQWLFDEMTSQGLMNDFDVNHDGVFDSKETLLFKKDVFNPLKEFSFFTHLLVGKKKIILHPKEIRLFRLENTFVIEFTLDLHPYQHQKKSIGFWDESFLCALFVEPEHIQSSLHYTLKEVDNAYYSGYLLELP